MSTSVPWMNPDQAPEPEQRRARFICPVCKERIFLPGRIVGREFRLLRGKLPNCAACSMPLRLMGVERC